MGHVVVKGKARRAVMSARVYRAATDTWEDLGVIAHSSRLAMMKINFVKFINKIKTKWKQSSL